MTKLLFWIFLYFIQNRYKQFTVSIFYWERLAVVYICVQILIFPTSHKVKILIRLPYVLV